MTTTQLAASHPRQSDLAEVAGALRQPERLLYERRLTPWTQVINKKFTFRRIGRQSVTSVGTSLRIGKMLTANQAGLERSEVRAYGNVIVACA